MSIPRVKPADWGIGEELSSAQINQLDTNFTYALDKRAGQTDTLSSVVTLAPSGRIIQSVTNGPNADQTFQIDLQVLGVRIGTPNVLTTQRNYTLSNTSASNGDEISFFFDPDALGSFNVLIKDNGGTTLATLGPTGQAHWGEFKFISGAWKLKRLGGMPLANVTGAVDINAGTPMTIGREVQVEGANNVQLATGNVTLSPARTFTRILPLRALLAGQTSSAVLGSVGGPSDTLESPTNAVVTQTYTSLTFAAVDTASSFVKMLMLNLTPYVPDGATITEVAIELRGAGGHAALPTVMPAMKVGRTSSGASAQLHSAANPIVDASVSVAAYQSIHGITATCNQNNVVDKSLYHYWVALFNEGSANAIAGLIVQKLTVTFTVPSVSAAP